MDRKAVQKKATGLTATRLIEAAMVKAYKLRQPKVTVFVLERGSDGA